MLIHDLKGLKYPDMALVRWFFKSLLHKNEGGKVLELACSSANNLGLFANYDYECLGVDISEECIENGMFNLKAMGASKYKLYCEDLFTFLEREKDVLADVFTLPNIINYFTRNDFLKILKLSKEKKMYKNGANFFLRTRSTKDFRFGQGKYIEHNCFKQDASFTGEPNCLNTFYQEYELVQILQEELGLYEFSVLTYEDMNVMGEGLGVFNADIVVYGKIGQ